MAGLWDFLCLSCPVRMGPCLHGKPFLQKICSATGQHEEMNVYVQVVYLDVDTLWIDSMANVQQEFTKMREKSALFGMAIETTALNGNGSWYKGGRSH